MTRRWITRTRDLAAFIEAEFLTRGVLDFQHDDLVIKWRDAHGVPLVEAAEHVEKHISAAGDYLREQGWYITNVTREFFTIYGATIPTSEKDLRACVPGLAGPEPTAGWHCRDNDNTELAIVAYFRDLNSGNGKVEKATRTMADAVNSGEADPVAVAARNDEAHLRSTMAQQRRVQSAVKPAVAVKP